MYFVDLSQRAFKFLVKLDSHVRSRIIKRLKSLSSDPVPPDSKFIGRDDDGDKIFRYRIGDYRVLYKVKYKDSIVLVAKIDKRPRVYN